MLRRIAVLSFALAAIGAAAVAPSGAYQEVPVTGGGTISGKITLNGEGDPFRGGAPGAKKLDVNRDQEACQHGNILSEELLIGAGKGVQNVVVWLENVSQGKKWDPATAEVPLDNVGCVFKPHVLVGRAGSKVKFINNDTVLHNVNTHPFKNAPINVSLLGKGVGRPVRRTLELPDVIKVVCDAHKWMTAWLIVRDNPYYAVTDGSGQFAIADIPPGTYTVQVWHELLGRQTRSIKVEAGKATALNLELKPASGKP